MTPQARISIACSAWRTVRMHSSRQIGRRQLCLQARVIDDVIVTERLLDHHQLELVEPAQMVDVGQRVRGVGVGHQLDLREALANAPPPHRHPSPA